MGNNNNNNFAKQAQVRKMKTVGVINWDSSGLLFQVSIGGHELAIYRCLLSQEMSLDQNVADHNMSLVS